jgi:predicted N-acyltransferase
LSGETRFRLETGGVAALDPAGWDRLAGGDPLVGHAFLSALETSGSVGRGSGWQAIPLVAEADGALVGAVPLYAKAHSQGEYVFDQGWAQAFERAGGAYYPKFQAAVPFTPCPGRRLLGDDPAALVDALGSATAQNGLSGCHVTFCTDAEADLFAQAGWLVRDGLQYHFANPGYRDVDDYLSALSSRKRKAVRKERAAANAAVTIETLRGGQIDAAAWDAMWQFYQDTGARKWGRPYLTRAWFEQAGAALGENALMFLARDAAGNAVAGALNIVGPDTLYGRYWGALAEIPFLHFELSYYRAIEWAIAHGLATVQAGAQGEHKLARGYAPVVTRSAHWIAHPGLRDAIAEFIAHESAAIAQERDAMLAELPYRNA